MVVFTGWRVSAGRLISSIEGRMWLTFLWRENVSLALKTHYVEKKHMRFMAGGYFHYLPLSLFCYCLHIENIPGREAGYRTPFQPLCWWSNLSMTHHLRHVFYVNAKLWQQGMLVRACICMSWQAWFTAALWMGKGEIKTDIYRLQNLFTYWIGFICVVRLNCLVWLSLYWIAVL